jgi:hypothetical protein
MSNPLEITLNGTKIEPDEWKVNITNSVWGPSTAEIEISDTSDPRPFLPGEKITVSNGTSNAWSGVITNTATTYGGAKTYTTLTAMSSPSHTLSASVGPTYSGFSFNTYPDPVWGRVVPVIAEALNEAFEECVDLNRSRR